MPKCENERRGINRNVALDCIQDVCQQANLFRGGDGKHKKAISICYFLDAIIIMVNLQ